MDQGRRRGDWLERQNHFVVAWCARGLASVERQSDSSNAKRCLTSKSSAFSRPPRNRNRRWFFTVSSPLRVWIEFLQNFPAGYIDLNAEAQEYVSGFAFSLVQEPQQQVLGADVSVAESLGCFGSQGQCPLDSWSIGNITEHLLILRRTD